MPKKKSKSSGNVQPSKKPRVHKELEGFEINIDPFGKLKSTLDIEQINAFLNRNVEDKKLAEREDYDMLRKTGKAGKKRGRKKNG
jgi:hypothetical protein